MIALVLLAVIPWATADSASLTDVCQFSDPTADGFVSFTYVANDIQSFGGVTSEEECCDRCKQTQGCIVFAWASNSNSCWVKHSFPTGGTIRANRIVGVPTAECQLQFGFSTQGASYASFGPSTLDSCCDTCNNDKNCEGFHFKIDGTECTLYSDAQGVAFDAAFISGTPSRSPSDPHPEADLVDLYNRLGKTVTLRPPQCAEHMIGSCDDYEACCLAACIAIGASTVEYRCEKYKDFVKYSLSCVCVTNGGGDPSPDFCEYKCAAEPTPGETGDRGFQGDLGETGDQGNDGPNGQPGEDGHPGDDGDPGPHGDEGPDGDPGIPGDNGVNGNKGPIGATGEPGDKGPFGEEGTKGYKGDPGIPGLPGACGHNGEKGHPGDDGEKGYAGNTGVTGGQGGTGLTGDDGDEGLVGPPGSSGQPGHDGPRGRDGQPGEPGGTGQPGPQGDKGVEGTYGTPGHAGPLGDEGDTGEPGTPGERGDPGTSGGDGAPGPKGPQGEKGTKGSSEYNQNIIFHE